MRVRYKDLEQRSNQGNVKATPAKGVKDIDVYLENVKPLILYHLSVISQKIHAKLEVLATIDIGSHNLIIGTREQNFT